MRVSLYDHAYEKSYKNKLGPGPAAYSRLYDANATDRFRKTAFTKSLRKLTQGEIGAGPAAYDSHKSKDK